MTNAELASGLIEALADALAKRLGTSSTGTTSITVTATTSHWSPERFWACPDAVRLDAADLARGLGVSKQTVHRRVKAGMPTRKIGGALVFVAGDVRTWLTSKEVVVNGALVPARPRPPVGSKTP